MRCPTCSALNPDGTSACASCGSPMEGAAPATGAFVPVLPSLPPNSRLKNGAFAVKDVLGQGGFGITYKGGDLQLRRYVAIKEFFPFGAQRQHTTVFPPSGVTEDVYAQAKRGFVQEAMTLAKFNHSGIVRVFGAFEENNTAYMVMELLEGQSLQKRLEEKGVLPEKTAVRLIAQAGEALSVIHEAKMLHRDIKPDNIMLVKGAGGDASTREERAVLIDFGTAREFAANKTKTMTAMVTHGYAPLEQYGKQAKFGPYTDVYALGATLYHCLTGQLPVSVMDRMAGVELKSPEQVNPNISRAVSEAVMHALQVKAPDRPQTVAEWIPELTRAKAQVADGASTRTTLLPDNAPQNAPVPAQPATGAGNQSHSRTCQHCGAGMSFYMTICPSCRKSNADPTGSAPAPHDSFAWPDRQESAFEKSVSRVSELRVADSGNRDFAVDRRPHLAGRRALPKRLARFRGAVGAGRVENARSESADAGRSSSGSERIRRRNTEPTSRRLRGHSPLSGRRRRRSQAASDAARTGFISRKSSPTLLSQPTSARRSRAPPSPASISACATPAAAHTSPRCRFRASVATFIVGALSPTTISSIPSACRRRCKVSRRTARPIPGRLRPIETKRPASTRRAQTESKRALHNSARRNAVGIA